jgi:hypothetical protein
MTDKQSDIEKKRSALIARPGKGLIDPTAIARDVEARYPFLMAELAD